MSGIVAQEHDPLWQTEGHVEDTKDGKHPHQMDYQEPNRNEKYQQKKYPSFSDRFQI
jgi:hypothetical protein